MANIKKYKIIVSNKAKQMLDTHIRFIANVNKEAAKAEKSKIISAIHSLSQMPNRFPFLEEPYIIPNKYHKMFVEKQYLIIYMIQDDIVYLDYILDCRKDYSWFIH